MSFLDRARAALAAAEPAARSEAEEHARAALAETAVPAWNLLRGLVKSEKTDHVRELMIEAEHLAGALAVATGPQAVLLKRRVLHAVGAVEAALEHDVLVEGKKHQAEAIAIAKVWGGHLVSVARAVGPLVLAAL